MDRMVRSEISKGRDKVSEAAGEKIYGVGDAIMGMTDYLRSNLKGKEKNQLFSDVFANLYHSNKGFAELYDKGDEKSDQIMADIMYFGIRKKVESEVRQAPGSGVMETGGSKLMGILAGGSKKEIRELFPEGIKDGIIEKVRNEYVTNKLIQETLDKYDNEESSNENLNKEIAELTKLKETLSLDDLGEAEMVLARLKEKEITPKLPVVEQKTDVSDLDSVLKEASMIGGKTEVGKSGDTDLGFDKELDDLLGKASVVGKNNLTQEQIIIENTVAKDTEESKERIANDVAGQNERMGEDFDEMGKLVSKVIQESSGQDSVDTKKEDLDLDSVYRAVIEGYHNYIEGYIKELVRVNYSSEEKTAETLGVVRGKDGLWKLKEMEENKEFVDDVKTMLGILSRDIFNNNLSKDEREIKAKEFVEKHKEWFGGNEGKKVLMGGIIYQGIINSDYKEGKDALWGSVEEIIDVVPKAFEPLAKEIRGYIIDDKKLLEHLKHIDNVFILVKRHGSKIDGSTYEAWVEMVNREKEKLDPGKSDQKELVINHLLKKADELNRKMNIKK